MQRKIVIKIERRGGAKGFLLGCIWRKRGDEGEGFQTKVMKKVAETHGSFSDIRLSIIFKPCMFVCWLMYVCVCTYK